MLRIFARTLLFFTIGCLAVQAQEVRASISGLVTDRQGAPVPGVAIIATHLASNTTVSQETNDSGFYITPFLTPGAYRVTAEALKRERSLCLARAGPYANAERPDAVLAQRVERIVSQEYGAWADTQRDTGAGGARGDSSSDD